MNVPEASPIFGEEKYFPPLEVGIRDEREGRRRGGLVPKLVTKKEKDWE